MIGLRAYARRRGVALSSVQAAIRTGRIRTRGGKIDPDEADKSWDRMTDTSKPRNSVTGSGGNGTSKVAPHVIEFHAARARRERIRADREQMDLDRDAGKLLDLETVKTEQFALARRLRDALQTVPERVAAALRKLAADADWDGCRRVVADEIRAALKELGGSR